MKRFYKSVDLKRLGGQFGILLDGRPVKTPERDVLALRSGALAAAVAAEWARQGDELGDMPLTRLANTAIDRVRRDRTPALEQIDAFARHDLVCYRSAHPAGLVAAEAAAWDFPLFWARTQYGLDLRTTDGTISIPQPGYDAGDLAQRLSRLDEFALTGLSAATPILKSTVLALALADGRLDAAAAHAAAHVDETFQAEKWGRDAEAEKRLKGLLAELETTNQFLQLAKG
ncbi:MAG: ATP12 family protein [Rhizomicrobium sp.]